MAKTKLPSAAESKKQVADLKKPLTAGKLSKEQLALKDKTLKQKLSESKTQRGQLLSSLLKVNTLAGLNLQIDASELKNVTLGKSSQALIKAFQQKYKLPVTGEADSATYDKIVSVAASRGVTRKMMPAPKASGLQPVKKTLRLNMISDEVAQLQKNLAFMGYRITDDEYQSRKFGKTTRLAVMAFQKDNSLPGTGEYDRATAQTVNASVIRENPQAAVTEKRHRVRGSVHNLLWEPMPGVTIKAYRLLSDGSEIELGTKQTMQSGFYDISYKAPEEKYLLLVKLYQQKPTENQKPDEVKRLYNTGQVTWINFTESERTNTDGTVTVSYKGKYAGESEYEKTGKTLLQAMNPDPKAKKALTFPDLKEDANGVKQISLLSKQTGITTDNIMYHVLAVKIVLSDNLPEVLTPEVFYAFIAQRIPSSLSGDLLREADDWNNIDRMTENALNGIVFTDRLSIEKLLDSAVYNNLVSRKIKENRKSILESLDELRIRFTLEKPVLTGDVTLRDFLSEAVGIPAGRHADIAKNIIETPDNFLESLKGLGFSAEIESKFALTAEIGRYTGNYPPAIKMFRDKLKLKQPGDIAKLGMEEIVKALTDHGDCVPDTIKVKTKEQKEQKTEKIKKYAASIKAKAESLYPEQSIYYDIFRGANHKDNWESLKENDGKKLLTKRLARITDKPDIASKLNNSGNTSALKIYSTGEKRLAAILKDDKQARKVYKNAELQYLRSIDLLKMLKQDVLSGSFAAVSEKNSDISNWESLFGSLDYFDDDPNKSLYSPAAYLTDLLRYLDEQDSVTPGKTVKDVLFERRPDIGNILLNGRNTETPMPCIDLICEILENCVAKNENFNCNSTLSAKELRSMPEHINVDAYNNLAKADYPMEGVFNLWQEESRLYMNHLGFPRWELMEIFRNRTSQTPDDTAIAAEFFGISRKEQELITTPETGTKQLETYWGYKFKGGEVTMKNFMGCTGLSYSEILTLLETKFISPKKEIQIKQDLTSADLNKHFINGLKSDHLDRIHRFIRLWRKTGWEMWELDLLIHHLKIGKGQIDENTLINLKKLKQLQEKAQLPVESLLAFYGLLNEEEHANPSKPEEKIPAIFSSFFPGKNAGEIEPLAVRAAFKLTEDDYDGLIKRTGAWSAAPAVISALFRYNLLATALKLPVTDLFQMLDDVTGIKDPFADIQTTLDVWEYAQRIKESGWSLTELTYLLKPEIYEFVEKEGEAEKERIIPEGISKKLIDRFVKVEIKEKPETEVEATGTENTEETERIEEKMRFVSWPDLYVFLLFDKAFPEKTFPESDPVSFLKVIQAVGGIEIHRSVFPDPQKPSPVSTEIIKARHSKKGSHKAKETLVTLTGWDESELTNVEQALGMNDYTNAALYPALKRCFDAIKRTGIRAKTLAGWHDGTVEDKTIAEQMKLEVKAKYGPEVWPDKIAPLQDTLREKKSRALMAYLIAQSQREKEPTVKMDGKDAPNPEYWQNTIDLYKYFLIDTEMTSAPVTSRIKQAISSVQLFVQRCFLNLEKKYVKVSQGQKEDASSLNSWSQWSWMKNYRIWEANRKIFFYPENWIEPELRDDKSPFFKELEDELMQNEVTKENAEQALLNYLHKLDEVSRLEVCGLYRQQEDLDDILENGYETDIIHVIARTKNIPNTYYYRTYDMNYSTWSAWEKIEVDITGDHIMPVVYNRKLHIFWLQFMEKPKETKKVPAAKASEEPTDAPETPKYLEIQLAWTVKQTGKWSSKKLSKKKLIHGWERPQYSYNLKPYYRARTNELCLDIYLSSSSQFNNRKFYDPETGLFDYRTKLRYNETFMPWHSSSFLFDGDVKEVQIIRSEDYYNPNEDENNMKPMDPTLTGPQLHLPSGMHYHNTHLTHNKASEFRLNVLHDYGSCSLLKNALSNFELVITQQEIQFNALKGHPMFYQDDKRAFFIKPHFIKPSWKELMSGERQTYRFDPFYHPYTNLFIRELNRDGIDGLLNRNIQTQPETLIRQNNQFNFEQYDYSTDVVKEPESAVEKVDFSFGGAYAVYNWELFFHAPLLIACSLMRNQKFEDAMSWFHYIFNPTNIDNDPAPQRYWITKPFYESSKEDIQNQNTDIILDQLSKNEDQLRAWKNSPFKPHLIARYRPAAYQKNVVMKYLDNLIAWGDMLFRSETLETINEASLLYMLAYEILGQRPQKIFPATSKADVSFNGITPDEMGNFELEIRLDEILSLASFKTKKFIVSRRHKEAIPQLPPLKYFSLPANDYMTKYWDTVEDRLYKIRHSLNIDGVFRQLPLFEPPIDPALLVKAAAAGVSISDALNMGSKYSSFYRFRIVVQKAIEFCNDVKGLGEKLLSALEKKDAETLSLLRSRHEIQMLEAVKQVRKKQIDEAKESIASLNKSLEMAEGRKNFYEEREFMNIKETTAMKLLESSDKLHKKAESKYLEAQTVRLMPNLSAGLSGFGGSPIVNATYGSEQIAGHSELKGRELSSSASALDRLASMVNTTASYQRRQEEWDFQAKQATKEIEQIQRQIIASEIRLAIAEKELENQEIQIENTKVVDEYMRSKYTNEQLYGWMITQISGVYFQAYRLAYDMAKKAENCFNHELPDGPVAGIVRFDNWDSLRKGLLSGDKLMYDLHQLEAEYMNRNKRNFEITKHISLAQMFPEALMALKQSGECAVKLDGWLFDMDYPGHYMRRIKNVSVSIPCIVGPYTSINCILTLTNSAASLSSIATSSAQRDSGMFELNFNDERYLPFEGAEVEDSTWQISLPKENNYFDFASLSDVVLHINYTAKNGDERSIETAQKNVEAHLPDQMARIFNIKHEFPTEWSRFVNEGGELSFELKPEHFPFFIRTRLNNEDMKINKVVIFKEDSNVTEEDNEICSYEYEPKIPIAPLGKLTIDSNQLPENWNQPVDNLFIIVRLGK